MSSNDRLRAEIHRAADFIAEIDLPEFVAEFTPEVVRLYKVNTLCNMFFWVGLELSRCNRRGGTRRNRCKNALLATPHTNLERSHGLPGGGGRKR